MCALIISACGNSTMNQPAVKNGHVIEVDGSAFMFNDSMTLDYQLNYFEGQFLK